MKSKPILIAAAALCLTACATPSSAPPPPPPISPSLTAPCPPHLPPALQTWGDVTQAYAQALGELAECRARHRALADAAAGQ